MELEEKKSILLTFDVEDWFQVENFKNYISYDSWPRQDLRVEKNVHKILDLMDFFLFKPKATFFVLGWVAEKLPAMVREILNRGHEVASHGNLHHLCTRQPFKMVEQDLKSGKALLEDIIGHEVYGYRAPSFAINNDILKIIKDTGHIYDSSYNSFSMHERYGKISLPEKFDNKFSYEIEPGFYELPVSNLKIGNKIFPLGGGGYFRLLPFSFFKLGVKQVLKKENAFLFYSHPWEFDPDQPRVEKASKGFKFRHYINLKTTYEKLKTMIGCFKQLEFAKSIDYIKQISRVNNP